MDEHTCFVDEKRLERVKAALEKNQITAHILQAASEVVPFLRQHIPAGATVSNGGSMTLRECGAIELLRNGAYNYLDRDAEGVDKKAVQRAAFGADYYLASANAVTEQGEIFEMDGAGNRVAALVYGPDRVILVVGRNKIVENLEAARRRNALVAAPANCHRLGTATPCAVTGICQNCSSPGRICNAELVLHRQLDPQRMTVLLVNEPLGY